jgi:hypothetical protein
VVKRLIPSLTEAQEALVLDKLASIALNEELGPLRDAMNLLAEEGMGNVIQAFADGTMTKQEFLETALLVREAIDDENKALKEQEGLLKRLKEATAVRFAPIMKTREEELAGMIGGAPLTREERVRAHAAGLLSTRNPGLIVSGAATLMGAFPGFTELILELLRAGMKGMVAATQSFAGGGVVSGPIGVPQLAVVHGGEVVSQPGRNTGQNVLNITMQVMGDIIGIDDLDDHIRRVWTDTARRGGFDGLIQVN